MSSPGGEMSSPGGEMSSPGGEMSSPGGEMPPPDGEMHSQPANAGRYDDINRRNHDPPLNSCYKSNK